MPEQLVGQLDCITSFSSDTTRAQIEESYR